jgi:hypothetical protein
MGDGTSDVVAVDNEPRRGTPEVVETHSCGPQVGRFTRNTTPSRKPGFHPLPVGRTGSLQHLTTIDPGHRSKLSDPRF